MSEPQTPTTLIFILTSFGPVTAGSGISIISICLMPVSFIAFIGGILGFYQQI
jgi:hypothetical protein